MTAVLLQPHSDDCALFASFLALKYRPHVITVFRSVKQNACGATQEERASEDLRAMSELGLDRPEQWQFSDTDTAWRGLHGAVEAAVRSAELVIAPAYEPHGPEQHNAVATAVDYLDRSRLIRYLTYTNERERSTWGTKVEPEPEWIARKLRALSCYRSQHGLWSTQHHFLAAQQEYVAP